MGGGRWEGGWGRHLYSYDSFDVRINEAWVERFQMLKEIQKCKVRNGFPCDRGDCFTFMERIIILTQNSKPE